ncbi:MAG: YraN family protein [Anaerolineae bacterium]|nr:YraN family protein [Anaerolineae bacterium]
MADRVGRKRIGNLGEMIARRALEQRGFAIVEWNWRCALRTPAGSLRGEIDIVARDGLCWVFVEVKTRRSRVAGLPEEALTDRKVSRLVQLAEVYLAQHDLRNVTWRIDLVAVELDRHDAVMRLEIIPAIAAD